MPSRTTRRLLPVMLAWVLAGAPLRAGLPSAPVELWEWDGRVEAPDRPTATNTCLVARFIDANDDGVLDEQDPISVIIPHSGGVPTRWSFTVVDARTGAAQLRIDEPFFRSDAFSVGDVTGNGLPEIVVTDRILTLHVIANDGSLVATRVLPERMPGFAAISLADINLDGRTDIVIGRMAMLGNGTSWLGTGGRGRHPNAAGALSIPVDLDPDSPGLEIVAGNTLYDAAGRTLWQAPVPDGLPGIADITGDGELEIVLVTEQELFLLDRFGTVLDARLGAFPTFALTSPPLIADLTGDGWREVVVAQVTLVTAFAWGGDSFGVLWEAPVFVHVSDTAPTAFDFDCDGGADVIYRDEYRWYVFDGRDGSVLHVEDLPSGTISEMPVVAQLTEEPWAGIVIPADGPVVRAYLVPGSATPRPIFNQISYHSTHVRDDGTIPTVQEPPWRVHNTFRAQVAADPLEPCGTLSCEPPVVEPPSAASLSECNRAIAVSWPEAVFPSGSGTYAVHRSDEAQGEDCDDALSRPPIAQGLADTSWVDVDLAPGGRYLYAVVAEDGRRAPPGCEPVGAVRGGTTASACAAAPVEATGRYPPPAGIGPVLRVARDAENVLLAWPGVRELLPGEHFHVRRSVADPQGPFVLASPEGLAEDGWSEPLAGTPWLLFYRLRVASGCEEEAPDDAPPP